MAKIFQVKQPSKIGKIVKIGKSVKIGKRGKIGKIGTFIVWIHPLETCQKGTGFVMPA
jgi:hypothetical protein